jgi:hypothetical protein
MQPRDLKLEQFSGYPPEARKLVAAHLEALRKLPLSILPGLLREAIDYDYKFPVERIAMEEELALLSSLTPEQNKDWFQSFERFSISTQLEQLDWINLPAQFTEQLSAHLWSTHQQDAYRTAATEYGNHLQAAVHPEPLPVSRLGIVVIGQGVTAYDGHLFKNLRQHGTYFNQIKPENGLEFLLQSIAERAKNHRVPYGHWYVDGGDELRHSSLLTCLSYQAMEPVRTALLKNIQAQIERPGMGPEELRTHLARLTPTDLGMDPSIDAVLSRFQLKVLTEGSGTQIFSTTFAQWATREILRRAQALTLLVRFAPRQRQRPMNELLLDTGSSAEVDPVGSLIDADIAAYYQWINQQRLAGYDRSAFLVWFEGHNEALVVAPTLPRGAQSSSSLNLGDLLSLAAG